MTEQSSLTTLITQYQTLCRYCDEVFAMTLQAFRSHIRCAQGCASCCILETVVPFEAFVITSYLETAASHPSATRFHRPPQTQTRCVFLHEDTCVIYPVRPLICRTHGLPIRYPDRQAIDACPLNFADLDLTTIDPQFVFDTERITQNLMRLNLAFCLITQPVRGSWCDFPSFPILFCIQDYLAFVPWAVIFWKRSWEFFATQKITRDVFVLPQGRRQGFS